MSHVVTVPELLDGHTVLDVECLDRIYLNGYVPTLQVGGQVFTFLHDHRGMPVASPAVFGQIGGRFRQAVARFAEMNDIPVVKFTRGVRKLNVMQRYLRAAARAGRPGVAAIGRAEEFQLVWDARQRDTGPSTPPQFWFAKAERRVTCYYFYVFDEQWGPAFIKVCAYFPYPVKAWVNGHEWAKHQLTHAGIGFTQLSNGFASCDDPAGLQVICDRLGPADIQAFFDRWMSRLPLPLTDADRAASYWWELSMRQVEVSRTMVFGAPRQARAFFEALVADNLDLGRPEHVEILFKRDPRGRKPKDQAGGTFRTAIDRNCQGVTINAFWRHSRVKQYLKDGRALRVETVVNAPELTSAALAACTTSPNSSPGHVRSTPGCWRLRKSARDVSSIVQPLRGYRSPPSPRMAGGPQDYGSATLESWPWPAPSPARCTPSPASRTRACAP